MPVKKTATQITEYYKKKNVVSTYDARRFVGKGGEYIDRTEIESILRPFYFLHKDTKVLDIGAGRGRLSLPLQKKKYQVTVLDRSKEMVRILRKYFARRILLQSIFDPLPKNKTFTLVTGLRFFDHFNLQDQQKILLNVKKNLETDGYVGFSTLNKLSLESWLSPLFPYGRYNFFYSDLEYRKMFSRAGFAVIDRTSSFFIPRGVFLFLSRIPVLCDVCVFIDTFLIRHFPQYGALFFYVLVKK